MAINAAQPEVKNRGWVVTFSATIALLMLGALYAWSVVSNAMADCPAYDHWTQGDKTYPYALCLIFFAVFTAVGGRIQDKHGPRVMIMLGGVLAGLGMIVCGLSASPIAWYIGFGVLLGIGIGLAYSSGTPPSVKWFPASKTGLISGIVVAGFGGGAVWVAPTLRALIKAYEIPTAMISFGFVVIVVMVIFAQFVKAPPKGYVPAESAATKAGAKEQPKRIAVDYPPGAMVKTWQFWALIACYAIGGGAGLVFIGKMSQIVTSFGFAAFSAIAVSILALGNGIGRVIYGKLSDNLGRKPVLAFALAFQAVLLVVLLAWPVAGAHWQAKVKPADRGKNLVASVGSGWKVKGTAKDETIISTALFKAGEKTAPAITSQGAPAGSQQAKDFAAKFGKPSRTYVANASSGTLILLMVVAWLIGANYGAHLAVMPAMTKDYFGLRNFGTNYGLVFQGWGVVGTIVMLLATNFLINPRMSAGAVNVYSTACYFFIVLLIVAMVVMLLLRAPKATASTVSEASVTLQEAKQVSAAAGAAVDSDEVICAESVDCLIDTEGDAAGGVTASEHETTAPEQRP